MLKQKEKLLLIKILYRDLLLKEKKKDSIKFKILYELSKRDELNFSLLQKVVKKKNIYSQLRQLHNQGAVTIVDEVEEGKGKSKESKVCKTCKRNC